MRNTGLNFGYPPVAYLYNNRDAAEWIHQFSYSSEEWANEYHSGEEPSASWFTTTAGILQLGPAGNSSNYITEIPTTTYTRHYNSTYSAYMLYPILDLNDVVTSLSEDSTNDQIPSAKCVYNLIGDIESLLSEV